MYSVRRPRVWLLTAIVIVANFLGNLFLSKGLKIPGVSYPLVVAGILLLIFWTLSRMTLLSWADLSFVLPVTSLGYVLAVFAGQVFLGEQVPAPRWTGTLLIVSGTVLVGLTAPRTKARTAKGASS